MEEIENSEINIYIYDQLIFNMISIQLNGDRISFSINVAETTTYIQKMLDIHIQKNEIALLLQTMWKINSK